MTFFLVMTFWTSLFKRERLLEAHPATAMQRERRESGKGCKKFQIRLRSGFLSYPLSCLFYKLEELWDVLSFIFFFCLLIPTDVVLCKIRKGCSALLLTSKLRCLFFLKSAQAARSRSVLVEPKQVESSFTNMFLEVFLLKTLVLHWTMKFILLQLWNSTIVSQTKIEMQL